MTPENLPNIIFFISSPVALVIFWRWVDNIERRFNSFEEKLKETNKMLHDLHIELTRSTSSSYKQGFSRGFSIGKDD